MCLLTFILIASLTYSQNVRMASLTWSVNQLTDLSNSAIANYSCQFKTNGLQNIIWDQSNDETTCKTQNVTGDWTNVTSPGEITYSVKIDGETGTLKFERTSAGVFITLDLSQENGGRLLHKYSVSQISEN